MASRSLARRWLASLGAIIVFALTVSPLHAQVSDAAARAVAYIRAQQQPDGSFAGFGAGSTADAVYALAAANVNVAEVTQNGNSAITYIRSQAQAASQNVGLSAKLAIALLLAGQSPSTPEANFIAAIEQGFDPQTGRYGADVTAHAYAMIALVAAGEDLEPAAADALKALQLEDGGWSYDGTAATGSDTNTTGLVIQALVAAGQRDSDAVRRAIDYLRAQQNDDAGFPYSQASQFGNASDANSTALAIQGLIAAGEDLNAWAKNGTTPTQRLLQFQNASGAFRYQDAAPEDNALATYQAVPAVLGVTLPLQEIAVALPAPQPVESPAPAPVESPAPRPEPIIPPALPDTGAVVLVPAFAIAALGLMLAGVFVRRRA